MAHHFDLSARDARELWEGMYTTSQRIWSGNPNAALVSVVEGLAPGTALDLGCGEGADVVWLATRGWRATGVDVSDTAVARAARHAAEAGVADLTTFAQHDLGSGFPDGTFDLVTASFLHSFAFLDRVPVLRAAAGAVAVGGSLLVVGHADMPPWAEEPPAGAVVDLPGPDEVLAALALAPGSFEVLRSELLERNATGPEGQQAVLNDGVLHVRRVS